MFDIIINDIYSQLIKSYKKVIIISSYMLNIKFFIVLLYSYHVSFYCFYIPCIITGVNIFSY